MSIRYLFAAVAVATVATTLGAAAPAHADPGDIVVVTAQSFTNSVEAKGVFVNCPTNTRVLGGGGYIWNGARRVHLAASTPVLNDPSPDQWWAGGAEIRPTDYAASWRVHGYAICGPELPGLEYVQQESLVNSNSTRHQRVTCPGTKKLLSAGADILDDAGRVVLDDIAITSDLKNVDVWAVEREGDWSYSWSVRAYGVCVNSNAVSNLNRVQATSFWSLNDKARTADCGGQQVYGMGVVQAGSGGHTLLSSVVPTDTDGNVSAKADPTGAVDDWNITAQLVCGDE